tara:strand:- start:181 stop:384 length:204 start_codon:yes stop_codon:yes gene_type:complete
MKESYMKIFSASESLENPSSSSLAKLDVWPLSDNLQEGQGYRSVVVQRNDAILRLVKIKEMMPSHIR